METKDFVFVLLLCSPVWLPVNHPLHETELGTRFTATSCSQFEPWPPAYWLLVYTEVTPDWPDHKNWGYKQRTNTEYNVHNIYLAHIFFPE